MKLYIIVGTVVGAIVGLSAGFLGVNLNIWSAMGAGAVTALIAGFVKKRFD